MDLAAGLLLRIALTLLVVGGTGLFLGWRTPNFTKDEAKLTANRYRDIYGFSRYRRHRAGLKQIFYAGVVAGIGALVLHLININT